MESGNALYAHPTCDIWQEKALRVKLVALGVVESDLILCFVLVGICFIPDALLSGPSLHVPSAMREAISTYYPSQNISPQA